MDYFEIQNLKDEIGRLRQEVSALSVLVNKNSFTSTQFFNKDSVFQTRLRVPVYNSAPSVAEVGDLIAVSGGLFICTVAGDVATPATFTLVGSQV